tara:strand:- start:651 stop:1067 length:417 start_codon:yes stop_codon:yes gene_type:complete
LNIKFSIITFASLIIALKIFTAPLNEDIQIRSNAVEFLKDSNQISFINDVEISSEFVSISAKSAIYDNNDKIISVKGKPSSIKSSENDLFFSGTAEKIIFFSDEKIHLIGNAFLKYENISISSNIIIFNPQTGQFSSE